MAARFDDTVISLARQGGWPLFSAPEAMLKGVLESDVPVELVIGPPEGPWAALLDLARDDRAEQLLRSNGTALRATPDASRAVTLAAGAAASGHRAIAVLPNAGLDDALPALDRARAIAIAGAGALCLVLEDDPRGCPSSCPREAARRLDVPTLEPGSVDALRDSIEHALKLGRAGHRPVAVVAHRSILESLQTLEARPNRIADSITAAALRRSRRGRIAETGDLLRLARRLELNRIVSLPSPGERVPAAFIAAGPGSAAIDHLIEVLQLHGRVPVLHLGLLHPIDEPVLERLLGRSEQVVVLEPRPGAVEGATLRVAESLRRRGERPAVVCAAAIGDEPAPEVRFGPDDALHPSILARRIVPLLLRIRPGLKLPFVPDPPALPAPVPPRGDRLGAAGALSVVRSMLADVDQWLRDRAPDEEGGRTALAIDGIEPAAAAGDRVVRVETWSHRRFLDEGLSSIRQAAWDDDPWTFVICAVGADGAGDAADLERLVRGAIPGQRADGVRIDTADLNDRQALLGLLRETTSGGRLGIVIARDGPPPRFDVEAMDRARAEIDRLGYEPRQRAIGPADEACAISGTGNVSAPEPADQPPKLFTQFAVGRQSRGRRGGLSFRLRPVLDQFEVVRDRPPSFGGRGALADRLSLPQPVHAAHSQWRAHLAGYRGRGPGVAGWVLCEAGRAMDYHVRCVHDSAALGPGRRAWAQVLFTRPGKDHRAPFLTCTIPYGEADLLLGLEAAESLRAVDPRGTLRVANADATCAVVNLGGFSDDAGAAAPPGPQAETAIAAVSLDGRRLLRDFAAACRATFHTDRVTDLALVGAAFQRGMIPVSVEAIESAVRQVESRGFGRASEAFRFGRHLAENDRLFTRPGQPETEDLDRLVRRAVLSLKGTRWIGRTDADRFAGLLGKAIAAMPGLAETDPGRVARREFVAAMERCLAWGGFEWARRYAELVTSLYRADRGDKGRALTRSAILPLAEAMLIRDPIYVATMAVSPEQRRRARRRLNVKPARGDRLERRFLLRLEMLAGARRFRLDARTTEWPAWVAVLLRKRIPRRIRGTRRERQLRDLVIDVVERATEGAAQDYARWSETLQRLHHQAREERLRGMAMSELRMLVEESPLAKT